MKPVVFLKFFLSFTLVLWLSSANGQSVHVFDSIAQQLDTTRTASSRLLVLNELVRQSIYVDPEQGFLFAQEAIDLAAKEGSTNENYNAHSLFARLAAFTSMRLEDGLEHVKEALRISKEEMDVPRKTLSAEVMLGAYYDLLDQPDKALTIYDDAAETAYSLRDTGSLTAVYFNIARIYRYRSDHENAVDFYKKALAITKQKDLVTLAKVYAGLGAVEGNPDSAIHHLLFARRLYQDIKAPPPYLGSIADDIGNHYLEQEDYPNAAKWFEESMEFGGESPDSIMYFSPMFGLARALWMTGRRSEALEYALAARSFFASKPSVDNQLEVNETTADYLADAGRYEEAFDLVKQSLSLKDSINNQQVAAALAESNVRFATAEREATITEQQLQLAEEKNARSRLLLWGILALALVVGIFQYFFYRQRRRKAAVELALASEAEETARLRDLDTMKNTFFTNVSHELRTPITLIISPLEEVIGKLKQTNLQPDLELAHRNGRQLLGLVNEMLDLAKLEAGSMTAEATQQHLGDWLRRTFYSFESAANAKGITWEYAVDLEDQLQAKTDFNKLEKVINNLLSNALKFTPGGGTVTLAGEVAGDRLTLEVSDTGPGISASELPRVFDRFYQSAAQPATGGTGIGLALSRRLARLLGGDLTATSKVGEGSRFQLVLPLETETVRGARSEVPVTEVEEDFLETPAAPLTLKGERPRLLIVEDHPEMSVYLRKSLVREYDGTVAANGAAALRLLETQAFDLILSDVMMPVMDGFALREKINERPEWSTIPFIYLTARTLAADKLRGFQLGVDDYVTKPFQLAELKARMQSLLKNKQVRDGLAETEAEMDDESQLLDRAEQLVRERMEDLTFTVEVMAKELGYSQRQLSRVFGRLAGLTPVKFVLEVRLQHARHLLETKTHSTVAEVRYAIGIESASYFTRKFKERFGRSPKTYFEG